MLWNFGSLLGLCLGIQLLRGIFLAMHYVACTEMAYDSVIHIIRDVSNGWLLRRVHTNVASFFFFCVYIHIGRGIYYGSFRLVGVWIRGVVILVLLIVIAFLGYVLPWGQMSYWGATVITNIVTVIPFVGKDLLYWIWGGTIINRSTLGRFYVMHFLFPFLLAFIVVLHLIALHYTGSSNPLGIRGKGDMVTFHKYFTVKDYLGFIILLSLLRIVCLVFPDLFLEPENFNPANPLVTPAHIQPEWYFLFAYAILRSIPNKAGGVMALILSVLLLLRLMIGNSYKSLYGSGLKFGSRFLFWIFVRSFFGLTWIGKCPIEFPFMNAGQFFRCLYFSFFIFYPLSCLSFYN